MKLARCTENEAIVPLDVDIYPIIERARKRIVSRLRRAKVKLPSLVSAQNYIVTLLHTQRDQNAIHTTLAYYSQPLPDPLLKKVRKIWQQNKDNISELFRALDEFARQNPITRSDRPEIPELKVDDLKLICYMALV